VLFTVAGALQPAGRIAIPPDASARAFPLALAAMHGRDAASLLPHDSGDPHPDWAIDQDLEALRDSGDVTLHGLSARPDCVPALSAVAAARQGSVRIADVPALRHKESDRLAAMAAGLTAAGAEASVDRDDLLVCGPLALATAARRLPAPADHRVVMALSLLGTVARHGVVLPHAEAVQKSWPGFFDWLARCALVEPLEE
jgi:5-enolpyruvylshikimate-3-phosphate synthase